MNVVRIERMERAFTLRDEVTTMHLGVVPDLSAGHASPEAMIVAFFQSSLQLEES
jgi:hypothetical protein